MQASSTGADLELQQVEEMFAGRLDDECRDCRQLQNNMMAEVAQVSASASKTQVLMNRLADKLGSAQAAILEKQGSIESRVATWAATLEDVRQKLVVMEGGLDERCAVLEHRMDQCNPKQLVDEQLGEIKSFIQQYCGNPDQLIGKLQLCAGGRTIDMQQQLEKVQQQLDAVQAGIDEKNSQRFSGGTGGTEWCMQEAAFKEFVESTCKRLVERMDDVQSASETRCKVLHAELGDLNVQGQRSVLLPAMEQHTTTKMQTLLEQRCCILEAGLRAQIEQVSCSQEFSASILEGFAHRVAALKEKADMRLWRHGLAQHMCPIS